jgi:hypothetical protein
VINPLRRTSLKPKAKVAKTSWRNPERVRLGNGEMSKLRSEAFERAHGRCENMLIKGRREVRCTNKISWYTGDLHHIKHRSQGGGDTISNVMAVCWDCHRAHHDQGLELEPCWKLNG